MAGSLPRARRVGGNRTTLAVLSVAVVVLLGVLTYLLMGGFFQAEPSSDLERDYQLLVQSLAQEPNSPSVLMSLAEVEYDLGKKAEALDHAASSVKHGGDDPYFHLRYATLLVRAGRLDQATVQLKREIAITGTSKAEPYFLLAQIQADQRKYDDAIKTMQTGLRIDPSAADMGIIYAQILEKSGKKAEAIKNYQKALKFLPNDEEAIAGLKRLGVRYVEPTGTADPHGTTTEGQ